MFSMPMNPQDYSPEWKAISKRIRERDGNRCKWCGVPNGAIGYRTDVGEFIQVFRSIGEVDLSADAMTIDGIKLIRIVLTTAHLDHDTHNNDDANLVSLCQRDHLNFDAKLHAQHAGETRRRKRVEAGQFELMLDNGRDFG